MILIAAPDSCRPLVNGDQPMTILTVGGRYYYPTDVPPRVLNVSQTVAVTALAMTSARFNQKKGRVSTTSGACFGLIVTGIRLESSGRAGAAPERASAGEATAARSTQGHSEHSVLQNCAIFHPEEGGTLSA